MNGIFPVDNTGVLFGLSGPALLTLTITVYVCPFVNPVYVLLNDKSPDVVGVTTSEL